MNELQGKLSNLLTEQKNISNENIHEVLMFSESESVTQNITASTSQAEDLALQLSLTKQCLTETRDLAPIVICEVDVNLRLTYVNKFGANLFGLNQKDIENGVFIPNLFAGESRESLKQNALKVLSGSVGEPREFTMVSKQGKRVDVQVSSMPICEDGVLKGVRACVVDITSFKNVQNEFNLSEKRFRAIFANSPIAMALFMSSGVIIQSNTAFSRLCYALLKNNEMPFAANVLDIFPSIKAKIEMLLAGHTIQLETYFEQVLPEGVHQTACTKKFIEMYATPINEMGMAPLFLLQIDDITNWKNEEEALLQKTQLQLTEATKTTLALAEELALSPVYKIFITCSPLVKKALINMREIASSPAATLVLGESGTGKELIAHAIHSMGPRKDHPLVALNCSAVPENLLEAELFGHVQGAFTDAKKSAIGKIALAEGGSLFLDEIGDISLSIQVKLLRFLQDKMYYPLGSSSPVKADVRVITATNRNLKELVAQGKFREDFYYRINVLKIDIPPLRERKCDIPLLCEHFLQKLSDRYNKNISIISNEALTILMSHSFPGNVRELENLLEQAFVYCSGDTIESKHISLDSMKIFEENDKGLGVNLGEIEKDHILKVLAQCNNNKAEAAKILGMHRTTLFRKLKEI